MMHVMGECRASYSSSDLVLRRHHVPASDEVSIQGPVEVRRAGAPPRFSVSVPASRFYAVELATSLALFNPAKRGARDEANFYGSWSDGAALSDVSYTPPLSVWLRLAGAERLFYRILGTTSRRAWTGVHAWPPDWVDAPFVRVVDELGAVDRTLALVVTLREGATERPGPPEVVRVRLDRRSNEEYDAAAILTSDVVVPFDVVR